MSKWADGLIVAVKFNAKHTHIDRVRYREDLGDSVGAKEVELTRLQVVQALRNGNTFCTVFMGNDTKWKKGAAVRVVSVENQEFIKTLPDKIKIDNLDNLPEF